MPRGWLFARRLGTALARDAVELLRLLGILAALILGIVLGVVVIREKRGRDTRRDAKRYEREQPSDGEH